VLRLHFREEYFHYFVHDGSFVCSGSGHVRRPGHHKNEDNSTILQLIKSYDTAF